MQIKRSAHLKLGCVLPKWPDYKGCSGVSFSPAYLSKRCQDCRQGKNPLQLLLFLFFFPFFFVFLADLVKKCLKTKCASLCSRLPPPLLFFICGTKIIDDLFPLWVALISGSGQRPRLLLHWASSFTGLCHPE